MTAGDRSEGPRVESWATPAWRRGVQMAASDLGHMYTQRSTRYGRWHSRLRPAPRLGGSPARQWGCPPRQQPHTSQGRGKASSSPIRDQAAPGQASRSHGVGGLLFLHIGASLRAGLNFEEMITNDHTINATWATSISILPIPKFSFSQSSRINDISGEMPVASRSHHAGFGPSGSHPE